MLETLEIKILKGRSRCSHSTLHRIFNLAFEDGKA